MKKLEAQKIKDLLKQAKNIFITTHHKPDGDALGSSLALYHYFKENGYNPAIVSPTDYGTYLQWMPGNENVIIYTDEKTKSLKLLSEADLIFCLDFNALDRINELGEHIAKSTARKILIDHHTDPQGFEDAAYMNSSACATAELIYDFIIELSGKNAIDQKIGSCIYTGIVTDSGSFRYRSTTPHVHQLAAHLLEIGIDHSNIHQLLFDNNPLSKLKFFGYCLNEKLVVLNDLETAYIHVSNKEIKKFDIQTGETEGLVNYALSITGIKFAALIIERGNLVKMSFRSMSDFPSNEFASRYFNGGGHFNASGGSSDLPLNKAVKYFISSLKEFYTQHYKNKIVSK